MPLVCLGEGYLLAGRVEDAGRVAMQALDVARGRGERGGEAWALRLLGEHAAHPAALDATRAESHYREALTLATELGMRPLLAHCHHGLGRLARRTGDAAEAEEHLARARAMYREMGMDFWLEQAA